MITSEVICRITGNDEIRGSFMVRDSADFLILSSKGLGGYLCSENSISPNYIIYIMFILFHFLVD